MKSRWFMGKHRRAWIGVLACMAALTAAGASGDGLRLDPVAGGAFRFGVSDGLKEPSGLAIDTENSVLWTVDDDQSFLFKLDLTGRVIERISLGCRGISGKVDGLEGITLLPTGKLALVREDPNQVLIVDPAKAMAANCRALEEVDKGNRVVPDFRDDEKPNKGLEGIAFDPVANRLLMLKEHKPRLIMASPIDLSEMSSARELRKDDGFDAPGVKNKKTDVSGLAFDIRRNLFWILSAEGRVVFAYDHSTGKAQAVPLVWSGKPVEKAEGVAIGEAGDTMYIVVDDEDDPKLLRYRIVDL